MGAKYINTDLVLESKFDLSELASKLELAGLFVVEISDRSETWRATFESGMDLSSPSRSLTALLVAVEGLDAIARRTWDGCTLRQFDIGFECHRDDFNSEAVVGHELLARIARLQASIRMTIYRSSE